MTKVWVVSCWLSRSSFDNDVLGVFTTEEDALRLARSTIDMSEIGNYENICKGYYEEASGYDSRIISVNCMELDKVGNEHDKMRLDAFTTEEEKKIIEREKG